MPEPVEASGSTSDSTTNVIPSDSNREHKINENRVGRGARDNLQVRGRVRGDGQGRGRGRGRAGRSFQNAIVQVQILILMHDKSART